MPFFINILKRPIKHTLVLLVFSFTIMMALIVAYLVLRNVAPSDISYQNPPSYVILLPQRVITDLMLVSRIILELAFVLFIAQIIYRLTGVYSKLYLNRPKSIDQ